MSSVTLAPRLVNAEPLPSRVDASFIPNDDKDEHGIDLAKLSEEEKERRALARRTKSALAADADAHRQEEKRRRWAEEGSYLTREKLEAGAPCRGCGLAIIDELGDWPPLMLLTDEERTERERMNKAFTDRHPDCRSVRWSMSGSHTTHCGLPHHTLRRVLPSAAPRGSTDRSHRPTASECGCHRPKRP
jgi:hypothetical protein